ncbi:MAG: hypothetical protein A2151_07015 [Candidatus Muproteobacteria bacterium RBG_16_65_34]|uniref:Uncharacterized protein n=1 Tax=Candidatus Muproteobacteria bacterium RBG_16_65_34 TaxID=1817760 RepID=A0A1F6TN77_9PROT|nr:MAG: hypothetical protein A2151_07015 [Candidatus Muproteobacteria bacterium RBG_16_65_34]
MTLEQEATATLKDGSTVLLRFVNPCDKTCIARGFDQLSARSRHLRFFSPINKLSPAQRTYLTKIVSAHWGVHAPIQ